MQFISGFHVHPSHSVNFLHMHVVCLHKQLIDKTSLKTHTDPSKFIETKELIKALKGSTTQASISNNKTYLSQINKTFLKLVNRKQTPVNEIEAKGEFKGDYITTNNLNNHKLEGIRQHILFQNKEMFVVLNNQQRPGAMSAIHLLVIPKKKLYNAILLGNEHTGLLTEMHKIGTFVGRVILKLLKPNLNTKRPISLNYQTLTSSMTSVIFKQIQTDFMLKLMVYRNNNINHVREETKLKNEMNKITNENEKSILKKRAGNHAKKAAIKKLHPISKTNNNFPKKDNMHRYAGWHNKFM